MEQVNILVEVMKQTLEDLQRGLKGELNVTEAMELLQFNLLLGKVPAMWEKQAYASLKNLAAWFPDLLMRIKQLNEWSELIIPNPPQQLPTAVWISGLWNPLKFLTASQQVTGRKKGLPLDNMAIIVIVTEFRSINDILESKNDEIESAIIQGL